MPAVSDAQYYISPAGKRFRSRAEIARAFGLAEDPRGSGGGGKKSGGSGRGGARTPGGGRPQPALSRDESYALARSKLADAQLPVEAGRGVRVVRYVMEVYHPSMVMRGDPVGGWEVMLWRGHH